MNKVDLADAVYRTHGGMSRQEATELVDSILGAMKTVLGSGNRVHLTGFGSFQVVRRNGRRGRNPHTGEPMDLPAHRTLVFRPSKFLLERLNDGDSAEASDGP